MPMPTTITDSIQNRTARSSLRLLKTTLQSFRALDTSDPANIDRVIKEAELLSTTCKKLGKYLHDDVPGEAAKKAEPPEPKFDIFRVAAALSGIVNSGCCQRCGGYLPHDEPLGNNKPDDAAAEGALRAVRNAERRA